MMQNYLVYILLNMVISWVKNGSKTERKWDNNPWSVFCDPHWEFIWCNKWHPGNSEKSTLPEIAAGTDFHGGHETKTTLFFLPANGVTSWLPPPNLVSLTSDSTVQPQNTYICIKLTGQVWESHKRISINTNHTYHHHSFP